jgi:hypothetical protein
LKRDNERTCKNSINNITIVRKPIKYMKRTHTKNKPKAGRELFSLECGVAEEEKENEKLLRKTDARDNFS